MAMANGQLKRILRRRPELDEADDELHERVRSRLLRLPFETTDVAPTSTAAGDAIADGLSAPAADDGTSTTIVVVDGPGDLYQLPGSAVGVMASDDDGLWEDWELEPDPAEGIALPDPAPEAATVPEVHEPGPPPEEGRVTDPGPAPVVHAASEPVPIAPAEPERPDGRETVVPAPPPSRPATGTVRRPPATASAAATRSRRAGGANPAVPTPYCPSCAFLLSPPPQTSRRCPRCREKIVVKHVEGRAVYLTEAAVAVFDLERRRTVDSIRWAKERDRWLKAAASVEAPAERIRRLGSAPLSAGVVDAAKLLYTSTVDRSFRTAKRERRWQDASRIKRDHAAMLYRFAGSPLPPPDDIVAIHREGANTVLRGLDAIARVAELGAVRCCAACDADDGQVFTIASELRTPRLPHAGCPRGLCRCDWFLASGDQAEVRRHLRRRARTTTPGQGPS